MPAHCEHVSAPLALAPGNLEFERADSESHSKHGRIKCRLIQNGNLNQLSTTLPVYESLLSGNDEVQETGSNC